MGWKVRRGRNYLYKSVRGDDGRVRDIYLGRGSAAVRTAAAGEDKKNARAALAVAKERYARLLQSIRSFDHAVKLLTEAELYCLGYHLHRGKWRKRMRRNQKPIGWDTVPEELPPDHPELSSEPEAVGAMPSGEFGQGLPVELEALFAKARSGDTTCLPELRKVLDSRPEFWERYGNVAAAVERILVGDIAKEDVLLAESVTRRVEALRQQLGGRGPLEKLLVERVVSASLQVQRAEVQAAGGSSQGPTGKFLQRQLAMAEARLCRATAGLARMQRMRENAQTTGSKVPAGN